MLMTETATPVFNAIGYHADQPAVGMHMHEQAECIVPLQGFCDINCGSREFRVKVGDCLYIPARTPHDQRNHDDCITYYLKIYGLEQRFGHEPRLLHIDKEHLLQQWCEHIELCAQQGEQQASVLTPLVDAWIARLAQTNYVGPDAPARDPILQRAVTYMQDMYAEELSLQDIAQVAKVSTSHLGHIFRKYETMSVMDYLRQLRMQHAKRLLYDDYLRIAEIGALVGYPDPNYFARQFKTFFGVSPRQARKQLHQHATL